MDSSRLLRLDCGWPDLMLAAVCDSSSMVLLTSMLDTSELLVRQAKFSMLESEHQSNLWSATLLGTCNAISDLQHRLGTVTLCAGIVRKKGQSITQSLTWHIALQSCIQVGIQSHPSCPERMLHTVMMCTSHWPFLQHQHEAVCIWVHYSRDICCCSFNSLRHCHTWTTKVCQWGTPDWHNHYSRCLLHDMC